MKIFKNITFIVFGVMLTGAVFAAEQAPLCPSATLARGASLLDIYFDKFLNGYVAYSMPVFASAGLPWAVVIGPIDADPALEDEDAKKEDAFVEAGEAQKNVGEPVTKHAISYPGAPVWVCFYGGSSKLVGMAACKDGDILTNCLASK